MADQSGGQLRSERHDRHKSAAGLQTLGEVDAADVGDRDPGAVAELAKLLLQRAPQPRVLLHRPDAVARPGDRRGRRAEARADLEDLGPARYLRPIQEPAG